jgi:hypothetical protein
MGLFDKFAKALGRKDEETSVQQVDPLQAELATLNKDGRLHARYVLYADNLGTLRLDSQGLTGVLKDVSYGGFAVRFDVTPDDCRALEGDLSATLTVLDRTIRCRLTPVRVVKQHSSIFAGFCIIHESADTLVFLREFIEPLRWGKSLMSIGEDVRNERLRGQEWTCLRGDGPTDLILRRGPDSQMAEAMLTFKSRDSYAELTYRNGILRTGQTITGPQSDPKSLGAQMASTDLLDPHLLRQAICILSASPSDLRLAVQPLLDEANKGLKRKVSGAA